MPICRPMDLIRPLTIFNSSQNVLSVSLLLAVSLSAGILKSEAKTDQSLSNAQISQTLLSQQPQLKPALPGADQNTGGAISSGAASASSQGLIVSTTPQLDGYHVRRYLGVVRGVRVFQPTISQNLKAGLKSMIGGEIAPYADMCEKARQQAYDLTIERATALGANAVIGLRFDSSSFSAGSEMGTEVICYGTAVFVEADH